LLTSAAALLAASAALLTAHAVASHEVRPTAHAAALAASEA
jgi:hypothetical protein